MSPNRVELASLLFGDIIENMFPELCYAFTGPFSMEALVAGAMVAPNVEVGHEIRCMSDQPLHDGMVGRNLPLKSIFQGCKESSSLILDKLDRSFGDTSGRALAHVAVFWNRQLSCSRLWYGRLTDDFLHILIEFLTIKTL